MCKILFVVTEDWYFCSHRLPLAEAAREAGFDVAVATRISKHEEVIHAAGIRTIPLQRLSRSSINIFRELAAFYELLMIYHFEQPDLVHQVALKPTIYGSFAAYLTNVPARVSALGGLGFVFSSNGKLAKVLKSVLIALFRYIFNNSRSRVIVQNAQDYATLAERAGVRRENLRLIPSAGVDITKYFLKPMLEGVPIVVLASRMLWDKGIGEFKDAAILLRQQGIKARFVLVGEPDVENPSSVSHAELAAWNEAGLVEWWGFQNDMPNILSQARIVCLPTYYGEGVPKVLIEAMACGRPIVTTDMPGCKELVASGDSGVLIRPRDSGALAEAIKTLLVSPAICSSMGVNGRKIAEQEYSLTQVVAETLSVYRELGA